MADTLRTAGVGMGGFWISFMEMVPPVVSLLVGVATFIYMCIKIFKEIK
tara:strand:+ start:2157 stop:2303 length:147 start_codon:yes stop_codon:yes gene_type:complete